MSEDGKHVRWEQWAGIRLPSALKAVVKRLSFILNPKEARIGFKQEVIPFMFINVIFCCFVENDLEKRG